MEPLSGVMKIKIKVINEWFLKISGYISSSIFSPFSTLVAVQKQVLKLGQAAVQIDLAFPDIPVWEVQRI